MQKFKKIIFLACVLLLFLSVPAFAAGNITITEDKSGKIIEGTEEIDIFEDEELKQGKEGSYLFSIANSGETEEVTISLIESNEKGGYLLFNLKENGEAIFDAPVLASELSKIVSSISAGSINQYELDYYFPTDVQFEPEVDGTEYSLFLDISYESEDDQPVITNNTIVKDQVNTGIDGSNASGWILSLISVAVVVLGIILSRRGNIDSKAIKAILISGIVLCVLSLGFSLSRAYAAQQFTAEGYDTVTLRLTRYDCNIHTTQGIETKDLLGGEEIGELPLDNKDGYLFKGWQDKDGVFYVESSLMPYTVLDLYPYFEAKPAEEYTIIFDTNGGTEAVPFDRKNVFEKEEIGELPVSSKENYSFLGWYTEKEGGDQIFENSLMPSNDVTYYAHFAVNTHMITLNVNSGDAISPSELEREAGANIGLLPSASKEGHSFSGWYTESENGELITKDTIMPDHDVMYYAHYDINSFEVNFDGNGGNVIGSSSIIKTYNDVLGTLPEAERENYDFIGWFTEPEGGEEITENTPVKTDITYYAHWQYPALPILIKGQEFYREIPETIKEIVFTDVKAPENVEIKDISDKQNGGVVSWIDGTKWMISSQRSGMKVIANPDSSKMFYCGKELKLDSINLSGLDTSQVEKMDYMFYGCSELTELDLNEFSTKNVVTMRNMFECCSNLKELDLNSFDTSNVTDMSGMFLDCAGLESLDLSNFETENATNMSFMFYGCSNLNALNIPIRTGNVTDMSYMFAYCSKISDLNISSFDTSKAMSMSYMFYGCDSLEQIDVSHFDTSSATDMSYMFASCDLLQEIDLSNFITSNVTIMRGMFCESKELQSINVTSFDTSNVTDMSLMFRDCKITEIDVSNFDTSKVSDLTAMFLYCDQLKELDLRNFNTENVISMRIMFSGCEELTDLNISSFDTSNVENMEGMFLGCKKIPDLGISHFNTEKVKNMGCMLQSCCALTSVDISNFDTGSVTDMNKMFKDCSNLKELDLSNFDTSNVTAMDRMFEGCCKLTNINIDSFNTSNVKSMAAMFGGCCELTSIHINGFNTSKVNTMKEMFIGCSKLKALDLSNFDTSEVQDMSCTFSGCTAIEKIEVSEKWNNDKVSNSYWMFNGCYSLKGAVSYDHNNTNDIAYANYVTGYFTYKNE